MSVGDSPRPIAALPLLGLAHIGIRVHELARSVRFYELLGFILKQALTHPMGLELNLILNAPLAATSNVLMDVPDKHSGITHFALLCPDILAAKAHLEAHGILLSGGPLRLGQTAQAIFVRDPDRNVIELHQRL